MNLEEIHFHDSILLSVVEDTQSDEIRFEVDYPTDWENNIYQKRIILFKEVLNYQVLEGAFHGPPTILDVSILAEKNNRTSIRIDTNAGYRLLEFETVKIETKT